MSPFLSNSIPKYKRLTEEQKNEWNSRNASTVHATTVTLICIYVLLFEESIKKDLVSGYSRLAEANIAVAVGYLSSDLLILTFSLKNFGKNWSYMLHHVSALYAYWFSLRYGLLSYFANFRLLAEVSTPFVNLRWALAMAESKDGKLYFYNGAIMTAAFFISRIVTMPYYYYMVMQVVTSETYWPKVTMYIHVSWISVCIALDLMNLLWFWKMLSGVRKHLFQQALDSNSIEVKKHKLPSKTS